ncbi:hypothetical protein [Xanthomonas sp. 3498]|nr:hypothetical protein [Xanthomonas sp. 3498]MBB5875960.1 hypothetical protein [Xanthomonas sp. 3498]
MSDPAAPAFARLRAHMPSWRELLGCTIFALVATALLLWATPPCWC